MFKLCFARMFLRALACLIIYLCAFRIARRLHACKHFLPLSPSFYIMHNLQYSGLCTFQRKKAPFPDACSQRFPAARTSNSNPPEIQCLYGFQYIYIRSVYTICNILPQVFRDNTVCVQSSFTSRKTASFSLHAIRVSLPARLPFCTHNARAL